MADIPNTLENRSHIIASRTGLPVRTVQEVLEAAAALDAEVQLAAAQ